MAANPKSESAGEPDFFDSKRASSTSSGDGGGFMVRLGKLESHMEYVQRDIREIKLDVREIKTDAKKEFKQLFGAIIFVALGLAGVMAKGFGWI